MVLSETKTPDSFATRRTRPSDRTRQGTKVFCFFSSEKKTFHPATAGRGAWI
jgi:hypothetical protein